MSDWHKFWYVLVMPFLGAANLGVAVGLATSNTPAGICFGIGVWILVTAIQIAILHKRKIR